MKKYGKSNKNRKNPSGLNIKRKRTSFPAVRKMRTNRGFRARMSTARVLTDDEKKEISSLVRRGSKRRTSLLRVVSLADTSDNSIVKANVVVSINENHRYSVKKKELLDLYFESAMFRKVVDSDHYIYIEGFLCLAREEAFKEEDGKWKLADIVRKNKDDYLIRINERVLSNGKHVIKSVSAAKLSSGGKAPVGSMRHFIDNSGPILFGGYAEALASYMAEKDLDVHQMDIKTGISYKQFERYLDTEKRQLPTLPYAVAICLSFHLIPARSEEMLMLAKHVLRYVSEEEMAYKYLLECCYSLSLGECNERLEQEGFKPLTSKRKN